MHGATIKYWKKFEYTYICALYQRTVNYNVNLFKNKEYVLINVQRWMNAMTSFSAVISS